MAFDLADATLDAAVNPSLPGAGSVIKAVRSGVLSSGLSRFGRIVVDLSRLVAYSVNRRLNGDGTVTYLINVQTPHASTPDPAAIADAPRPFTATGNSLRGKVVVVDPGPRSAGLGFPGA